ncbi:MAG: fibronectin type III domain-containing protein [Clostridia bacterium]|nr:fibronectin type III domain-containing protein [Clostridia bacterium]
MKSVFKRVLGLFLAVLTVFSGLVFVAPEKASAATDDWIYSSTLPSTVTNEKYYIEYKNIYRVVAKAAPASDWTNKGYSHSVFENSGEPYYSGIELETSSYRVLLGYNYYHWCSRNTGVTVNFYQNGTFVHYDGIPANPSAYYEYASYTDDEDARYKSYRLKYYDGSDVYCYSGFSCDGTNGTHGGHSYLWYKNYRYQDKVKVDYYTFEKTSGWTTAKDANAYSHTYRYKAKHTHNYGSWVVTKKATFTEDGSRYKSCSCGNKVTEKIYKVSSVKLSASAYSYDGKAKKPTVAVKDSKGNTIPKSRYSVSYSSGRKNIGKYTVTVKLKGNYYKGSKKFTFEIVPQTVKNLKITAGKNCVTLKWSKVSGVDGYRIYSYDLSTKKLTLLETTKNTSYKFSSLSSAKKYSYVVKSYKTVKKEKIYSKVSSVVSAQPYGKPTTVSGLKASSKTSSSIKLKWSAAKGNSLRYYVYSYNSSSKKYTLLGKTDSTSYTVKNLKASTTYKFAVCAYSKAGGGYFGNKSGVLSVKTSKPLSSPSVGTVYLYTEGKLNNVLIKWTANSSASGYKIYRSTTGKSGSYTQIARIENGSVSSYRDTTVLADKVYYYRVRSFKKTAKESAQSEYSKAKSINTYAAWNNSIGLNNLYYNIYNWEGDFGYPSNYVIPLSSYQIIFGNTQLARDFYNEDTANGRLWAGNCFGMSTTSSLLNVTSSGVKISNFNTSASQVSQLGVNDVGSLNMSLRTFIEAMQISQNSELIWRNRTFNDYGGLLSAVKKVQSTGKPVVIEMWRDAPGYSQDYGHAVLAYKAVKVNDSQMKVEVYDPNFKNTSRAITLYTTSSGKITGWYYCHNDTIDTGTSFDHSDIAFLTYDKYSYMWKNRKKITRAQADVNTLFVNSENLSILGENGEVLAEIKNGRLEENENGIDILRRTGYSKEGSEQKLILTMPTGITYTVVNNSADVKSFEATMVNVNRSADITTESDEITFNVCDEEEVNSVSVEAEAKEDFEILLQSSESVKEETVSVCGKGSGETVEVAYESGEISLENCEKAEISVK